MLTVITLKSYLIDDLARRYVSPMFLMNFFDLDRDIGQQAHEFEDDALISEQIKLEKQLKQSINLGNLAFDFYVHRLFKSLKASCVSAIGSQLDTIQKMYGPVSLVAGGARAATLASENVLLEPSAISLGQSSPLFDPASSPKGGHVQNLESIGSLG